MSDSEGDEPSKDSLEYKIRLLDEKLARAQVGDETKFKLMAQQLRQWGESLQTERIAREMLNERRTKESKLLESQVKMDLQVLQQARRDEAESSLLGMLEDMCQRMQRDVAQERTERQTMEEQLLMLLEQTCGRVEAAALGAGS